LAANIQDLNLNSSNDDQYRRFLAGLKYGEMNSRRSAITIPHENTFRWIFDESTEVPWDNFIHWLKSGEDNIYWISGKAGSGKSTLMKFIIDSEETKKALLEISSDTIVLSFFFWAVGTTMQRSITGMLCTLLHRMLRENKTAAVELLRDELEFPYKESISDWSLDELQRSILKVSSSQMRLYCIFIDGLDEVEHVEGQAELLEILEKFRRQPNIKLCVSSRPEPTLQDCLKN
jgi:Cdc6-like AAA superfamily ATPase